MPSSPSSPTGNPQGLKQAKVLKTMFSRIDSDGSGEIDESEMLQLVMVSTPHRPVC